MQVVLPEFDGRLLTTAISFKADDEAMPELGFTRRVHRPEPSGIALGVSTTSRIVCNGHSDSTNLIAVSRSNS